VEFTNQKKYMHQQRFGCNHVDLNQQRDLSTMGFNQPGELTIQQPPESRNHGRGPTHGTIWRVFNIMYVGGGIEQFQIYWPQNFANQKWIVKPCQAPILDSTASILDDF
jgi:hypothetical protein